MTAGAGLLHKELHGPAFARRGGRFEVLQLWVNLPARLKMTAPQYQGLVAADFPTVSLADEAGSLRVVAGEFGNAKGPPRTFTPNRVFDLELRGRKNPPPPPGGGRG